MSIYCSNKSTKLYHNIRRLVPWSLLRWPEFNHRPLHAWFVVDKIALEQGFSKHFCFPRVRMTQWVQRLDYRLDDRRIGVRLMNSLWGWRGIGVTDNPPPFSVEIMNDAAIPPRLYGLEHNSLKHGINVSLLRYPIPFFFLPILHFLICQLDPL
jgi:hypothetical protein